MCGRFTFQPTEAFYERFQTINRLDGLVVFQINPAPQDIYCEACYEHRSW